MAVFTLPRPSLSRALVITRREIRDGLRDWRIIAPILVLTLFFPALMNFTAARLMAFVTDYGAPVIGDRLIPFLLMIVGFFPTSVSLVIALESFVGEKERHSLEPLLSSPLTDLQLYIGKTIAASLPPLVAAYLGIVVYLTGLYIALRWVPTFQLLLQIVLLTTVQATVMVSGAVVISTQTTSVRAANLLASFIIVPMALLVQGESVVMFWARYDVLWVIIIGLVFVNVVLVRMGARLFNREELLGHELDEINLRAAWRVVRREFVGDAAGSPVRWYRREIPRALGRLRWPIAMMVLAVAAGFGLGVRYAAVFQLPPSLIDFRISAAGLREQLEQFGLFSVSGAGRVFFQNVRAVLIAAALGTFTIGVLGIVVLMLPMALVGYFMGQMSLAGLDPLLFFTAFILPHGLLEVPAVILVGAATIRLGASLLAPPPGKTVGDGWLTALADWLKVFLGLVLPLLVGAAFLEVYVTPNVLIALLGR
ncbi:MAG: stage II sporulation protein M [Chloroflexi bacterium]|nr:stage II sporulation protein M [Chloroflexota bacterium]MBI2976581.1 stage II sporulation protein M [Chloroflexota bacterium]